MEEQEKSPGAIVQETAQALGLTFGQTTAARAAIIAEHVYDEHPDRDIRVALMATGISVLLGKNISNDRHKSERAIDLAVIVTAAGERPAIQLSMLEYPVVLPGDKQVILGDATIIDLRIAHSAIVQKRRGIDRTERRLASMLKAFEGLPDSQSIRRLVASGAISIAPESRAS